MVNPLFNPSGILIKKAVDVAVEAFINRTKSADVSTSELEEEALRQDIETRVLQGKARIEQELAIARRIDNAEEVEIEEFYDASGDGALGAKTDGETITLGASGAGRKVTKRVYKFKGYNPITQQVEE